MNVPARIPTALQTAPFSGFTAVDYMEMIAAGAFGDMRVELVGGVLEKMMPAEWKHGECNVTLAVLLAKAYEGLGVRIGSDVIIPIDATTTRAADIIVAKPGFAGEQTVQGKDLILVVEIADTSLARDLGAKASDYARGGIPNYWVVDLVGSAVHVMSAPGEDGYATRTIIRFGEDLAVPGTDAVIVVG